MSLDKFYLTVKYLHGYLNEVLDAAGYQKQSFENAYHWFVAR